MTRIVKTAAWRRGTETESGAAVFVVGRGGGDDEDWNYKGYKAR
jgi:hypothetical protein